jgi:hypothetical protein
MKLLRWNNAQGPQGKSVEPSASHSGQGLEVRKRFLPVEGEIFSLTFPFIDQAIARFDRSMSAMGIFRQLSVRSGVDEKPQAVGIVSELATMRELPRSGSN